MQTSYLVNPELQAYFIIYKSSTGHNAIVQKWALDKLIVGLQPYVFHITSLLLKRKKPINKTEKYIYSQSIDRLHKEDIVQEINHCILYVLRKQKLRNTTRLYDYMNLVLRELFNGKRYSLNRSSSGYGRRV
jgi:hypothetical protein